MPLEIPNPRFDLRYEITPQDCQRLGEWFMFESGAGLMTQKTWRRMRNDRFLIAIVATPMAIWLARMDWPAPFLHRWLPFAFIGGGVFAWIIALRFARACERPNLERRVAQNAVDPRWAHQQGATRLIAGDEEFLFARPNEELLQHWSGVCRVDQSESLIILSCPDGRLFFVPVRAFASSDDAKAFGAFASDAVARSSDSDAQIIQRYVDATDAKCPACGYSLKGSRATRCPECSHTLDRNTMPEAWKTGDGRTDHS